MTARQAPNFGPLYGLLLISGLTHMLLKTASTSRHLILSSSDSFILKVRALEKHLIVDVVSSRFYPYPEEIVCL